MTIGRSHADDAATLERAVAAHIQEEGTEILARHESAARLVVGWLGYLREAQSQATAAELLDGFHAALIEAAGCLAMGLVRPAVFAMRAQVDMLLAWLYFRDHRVEWEHVELTGERYQLASDVLKYLRTYDTRFQARLRLLRGHRTRGEEDPYRLLSAHVHGQNSATIPPLVRIPELVQPMARCLECVTLQGEISEYLSDVLAAHFAAQWQDLPKSVTESIAGRLGPAALKKLCAS